MMIMQMMKELVDLEVQINNKNFILWKLQPDLRFGQIISNLIAEYGDPFYWEEDKFLANISEYFNDNIKKEEI